MTLGAPLGSAAETAMVAMRAGMGVFIFHLRGFRIALAEGTLAGRNPGDFKPRVALEQLDESLAHHSGGPQNAYRDLCHRR